jgi:hypothetical protein
MFVGKATVFMVGLAVILALLISAQTSKPQILAAGCNRE